MIGGALKGQGTYGCVFQPELECRGSPRKSKNPHMVGKITSKLDAKNEIQIARHLNKIPDVSRYVITIQGEPCTPRAKSKQDESDLEDCRLSKTMPLEKTVQLSMPWGGHSLNYINLHPRIFDYVTFAENLLAAGTFLLLNDVCHFDIGGLNMLFNKEYVPRFIDFGFSFRPSKINKETLSTRWRSNDYSHDTETPEVTLMITNMSDTPVLHSINELKKQKPAVMRLATFCGVDPSEWASELYEWTKESQSFQSLDYEQCWKLYWPGFDAWDIGTVLLHVLEIQMSMPGFKETANWKAKGELVKTILRGICRGNPAYRLDVAEALHLLTGGSHPLISSGSNGANWIHAKQSRRPHA
jgi:hypothetical protein